MDIRIINGQRPPNFARILAVFPMAAKPGVVFAYGHEIYVPSGVPLPPEIYDHEIVHCKRQIGMGVEAWWDLYLTDLDFRFNEELLSHRAEYQAMLKKHGDSRQARRMCLAHVAKKLCSPLYGRMTNADKAKKLLTDD